METAAHVLAVAGLVLTLWGSSLQASRSIEKATQAAQGPPNKPGDTHRMDVSEPGSTDDTNADHTGKKCRQSPKLSGLSWKHSFEGTLQDFEVRHFRQVATAWILLLVAGAAALIAEGLDTYIDMQS